MAREPYKPVWVIALVLAGVLAVVGVSRVFAPEEIVPWRNGLVAGRAEAAGAGKPLLLYFTADWCGPCRVMKRTTWADESVEAALRAYVPVRLDVDHHPDEVLSYRVESIPMMLVVDAEGDVIMSTSGAMSPKEFLAWLPTPAGNAGAAARATAMRVGTVGQHDVAEDGSHSTLRDPRSSRRDSSNATACCSPSGSARSGCRA